MEILLVLIILAVIAAAVFMLVRSRRGAHGLPGRGQQGPALRGRRGAARATRHDPMAEAVERHARATDPHEAAEAELRLQAQANRVASDLHAQQASTLESQAGGRGLRGRSAPADPSAPPAGAYGQPAYDEAGRPVYVDGQPPVHDSGQPPVYEDDAGRPVYEDGTPVHEDGRRPLAEEQGGPAYHDEQGRPVYPEDRPRY